MAVSDGDLWCRTTIELGPLRITREYRRAAPGPNYPFYEPPRARGGAGWRAAGALGVVLALSAGGLSMAATRMPAPRAPRYSVSLPVPQQPIAPAKPIAKARAATIAPPAAITPVAATGATTPEPEDVRGDEGSRAQAIAAALRSGEVQEWYETAGRVHGFVVAGEPERDGARTCRALSVLTRVPGGADRVDQQRACLPGAG